MNTKITIEETILAPISRVWKLFTDSNHIIHWNFAHESWHCPKSVSDFRVGGSFSNTMSAKDGSFSFDLNGIFDEIVSEKILKYHLEDGRKVEVQFETIDEDSTKLIEIFEPENENSHEMQKQGWSAILANFKKYVENNRA
ncbi:MAG: SRPBCC domain-containing protein [Chryseobacterium sp.]|nr:SRPBCC domain-containing protein [Candidatus Chryseobacterium enterohippi]